jgi:hypothetical protein
LNISVSPRRQNIALEQVLGSSITYGIAIGPQQGRKTFNLLTLPQQGGLEGNSVRVAKACCHHRVYVPGYNM